MPVSIDNPQDVGGLLADPYPSTAVSAPDEVDTPLSVALAESEKPKQFWEYQTHAVYTLLLDKGLITAAGVRRAIESLPHAAFKRYSYYEKWAAAFIALTIEQGAISQTDIDAALGVSGPEASTKFKEGDCVRVRDEDAAVRYRKPHLRTPGVLLVCMTRPHLVGWGRGLAAASSGCHAANTASADAFRRGFSGYLFGVVGQVAGIVGGVVDQDTVSRHNAEGPPEPVYRVAFAQKDLWEGYSGSEKDTVEVEIWQSWLEPATAEDLEHQRAHRASAPSVAHDHAHEHGHGHGHGGHDHGDHVHEERAEVEQKAVDAEGDAPERSRLIQAFLKVATAKNIVTAAEITARIERLEGFGRDFVGAAIVARAWTDAEYRARLLDDGITAAAELGAYTGGFPARGGITGTSNALTGTILQVVEDTPTEWHVFVCTLCSCYPAAILGLPPHWYKARSYRARTVRDPRGVLAEFGTVLPEDVSITVHDSNAETRFLKIPLRPEGTDGWSEDQLRPLVTRDCLIGVSAPLTPAQLKDVGPELKKART